MHDVASHLDAACDLVFCSRVDLPAHILSGLVLMVLT